MAGDLTEGGLFTLRFDDGDVTGCRITECDVPHSFDWQWPHADHVSEVHVEVHPDGDAARLVLVRSGLAAGAAPGQAAGWQAYLLALGAHAAGEEEADWWQVFHAAREAYAAQLTGR